MGIPLTNFGAVNTSAAFTATLQAAVNSAEYIDIPSGTYTLQAPITYQTMRLTGAGGRIIENIPKTLILGDSALGEEPMFHRPDWWINSSDIRIGTESPENQGTGCHVHLSRLAIQNTSQMGTILDLYNLGPSSIIECCQFGVTFRGITAASTFGLTTRDCVFSQLLNQTIVADDSMLRKAWCYRMVGHSMLVNCNIQGAMTGIVASGQLCIIQGGRFELMHYGIILGAKNLHQDQFGQLFPFTGTVSAVSTESIRRHIECVWVNPGTVLNSIQLTGTVAPQIGGGAGECEYGLKMDPSKFSARFSDISVSGKYSQACFVGQVASLPNSNNVLNNYGTGVNWL